MFLANGLDAWSCRAGAEEKEFKFQDMNAMIFFEMVRVPERTEAETFGFFVDSAGCIYAKISLSIYSLSIYSLGNSELWHPNFLW